MDKKRDDKTIATGRQRMDSGCYSTPCRTPLFTSQSRRGSGQVIETSATSGADLTAQDEERDSSSPEERSEATSHSTVKRMDGSTQRSSLTSPESHLYEDHNEDGLTKVDTDRDDSGHSSSAPVTVAPVKKLCTCHQLSSKSVKCRHCLLEASEALRKLFDKYSLSINSGNHVDYTTRYQNLLNNSQSKSQRANRCKDEDNVGITQYVLFLFYYCGY